MTERRPGVLEAACFAAMAYGWPVLRLWTQIENATVFVLRLMAVASIGVLLVALVAPRLRSGLSMVPLAAAVALPSLLIAGRWAALWSAAMGGLGIWGIYGRPPLAKLASPPRAARVLGALGMAAGLLGRFHDNWVAPAFLGLTIVVVLGGAARPALVIRVDDVLVRGARELRRFGVFVGAMVGVGAMWLVAFVVVGVPWALQRVLRWDPLRTRRRTPSRWIRRDERPEEPSLRWFREPRSQRSPARLAHAVLGTILTLTFLWYAVAVVRSNFDEDPVNTGGAPPEVNIAGDQLKAEPWFGAVGDATDGMFDRTRLSQYVGGELPDTRSKYVNIEDERRRSWVPDGPECSRLRVWVFGGSALFGVGQRDLHTLTSELARQAAAKGLTVDFQNWGVPGDVTWQELRRLERALERRGETPPDMVVFYDGFNDLRTIADISTFPWVRPGQFVGPLDRIHMRALSDLSQIIAKDGSTRDLTVRINGDPTGLPGGGTPTAIAQVVTFDDLARRLLASYRIPFVHVIQPMLDRRIRAVDGEPRSYPVDQQAARRFVAGMPDTVIDLTRALDTVRTPVFVDGVHIVEAGNVTVATRLLEHLTPQLTDIAATRTTPCS